MAESTFYEVLGITPDASAAEIKAAYRRLSRQVHPDRGGSEPLFRAVNEAYAVLSDPSRRGDYDAGRIRASGADRQAPVAGPDTARRHGEATTGSPERAGGPAGRWWSPGAGRRAAMPAAAGLIVAVAGGAHGDDLATLIGLVVLAGSIVVAAVSRHRRNRRSSTSAVR